MRRYSCQLRPSIKKLYVRRRYLGLGSLDRLNLKYLQDAIISFMIIDKIYSRKIRINEKKKKILQICIIYAALQYYDIISAPAAINIPLPKIVSRCRTLDSFSDEDFPLNFRFRSKDQLRRLLVAFQMPTHLRDNYGHKFYIEELLLIVLFYLHYPQSSTDLSFKEIFGWPYWRVNIGVKLFFKWMVNNWAYLIYDNIKFWIPYLPLCAESIKNKLISIGCPFDDEENIYFNVALFIDNVIWATCRPGGGPVNDGVNSPRNHPLIQQSFYSGWKMIHGLKWQTIGMPNGMMFHSWGPVSCRHNDCNSTPLG